MTENQHARRITFRGERLQLLNGRTMDDGGTQIHCPSCDGYGFHRGVCDVLEVIEPTRPTQTISRTSRCVVKLESPPQRATE